MFDLRCVWDNGLIYILHFLFFSFILFIYFIYLFIAIFIWLIYYFWVFILNRYFKINTNIKINLFFFDYISNNFTSDLSLGEGIVFFKNFLFYQPKLLAFNYFYNFLNAFYDTKKTKNLNFESILYILIFIFIFFIFILPFRILVKLVTGLSFLFLKNSAICTNQLADIINFNVLYPDSDYSIDKNFLQFISTYYFSDLLKSARLKVIYLDFSKEDGEFVLFNPNEPVEQVFRLLRKTDILKKSIYYAYKQNNLYYVNFLNSNNPGKTYIGSAWLSRDRKSGLVTVKTDINDSISFKDGSKYDVAYYSHRKPGESENIHEVTNFNEIDKVIRLKPVLITEKNFTELDEVKFELAKALLIAYVKPVNILTLFGVKVNFDYPDVRSYLTHLYDNKLLPPSLAAQFEYTEYYYVHNFNDNFELSGLLGNLSPSNLAFIQNEILHADTEKGMKINLHEFLIKCAFLSAAGTVTYDFLSYLPKSVMDAIEELEKLKML